MIRYIKIIFLLSFMQSCISCNNCDCYEGNGLEGFYICSRRATSNKEFLWLFNDSTYVHILVYDTIQFVNSDTWMVKKDPYSGINLFEGENWIRPCSYENSYCYDKMDIVNKNNFNQFKGSKGQLEYGCYIGLDNTCYFRLMDAQEPMYNYKRIDDQEHKVDLSEKRIEFYTKRDSTFFTHAFQKYNFIK